MFISYFNMFVVNTKVCLALLPHYYTIPAYFTTTTESQQKSVSQKNWAHFVWTVSYSKTEEKCLHFKGIFL